MMTPQDNFNSIRELIARYYDGLTSPEENRRLENFFSSTDRGALPDDLAEEAAFFAMIKQGEDALAASAPDYLNENLRAIIEVEEYVRPRRSKFIRFAARFAAAAAVTALLITIGLRTSEYSDMVVPTPDENLILTLVPPQQLDEDSVEESTVLATSASYQPSSQKAFIPVETPDINDMPDNYIEITNMYEAYMLAQDALALVREKLALASYSLSSASDGLCQIESVMYETIIN